MAKVIKYSTSAVNNTLKTGNMVLGANTADYGTSFYTTVEPPAGGYTIYSNKASGGPSINVAVDDTELIWYANSFGAGGVETIGAALAWFNTQADKTVISSTDKFTDIVSDGLVMHLDARNTISYPGTGSTWYDLVNTTNGVLQNGPIFESGSIKFDGTNDLVLYGSSPIYTATPANSTWTIEAIFKASGSQYNHPLVTRFQYNGVYAAGFNAIKAPLLYVNPYFVVYGTKNLVDDKIHHIAFTYDSVDVGSGVGKVTGSIYIDGILDITGKNSSVTAWDMVNQTKIGYQDDGASRRLLGNIYSVKIYNRVLTDSEIKQNYYNSITPNILFNTSCSAWYDCSLPYSTTDRDGFNTVDTTGTVTLSRLYDLSGNSRHGVQTTKSKQPTLGSLNRKTVIEALTSGKAVQFPNNIGGNPFTYFILYKYTGGDGTFQTGRGGASNGYSLQGTRFFGYSGQFNFAPYYNQVSCNLPSPAANSQYQLLILNCYPAYTEATVSIMGGNVEPSMVTLKNNYAGNNSLDYIVNCNFQNGFFCRNLGYPSGTTDSYGTGAVAEFVGVQKNCTAAEIAAMQNYFYNKWFK